MTHDELCWLAGWLEGEASFYSTDRNKWNSPAIKIQVFSTDRDILEKAAKLFGDRKITIIPPRECRGTQWKSKGGWRTELGGEPAAELMRLLYTMMGERRQKQIKKALDAWENRPGRPIHKLCACGCGRPVFGGMRVKYALSGSSNVCAMRVFRARQKLKEAA